MTTAMDTAMDELQHPPSPRHLADMYTSQNGTVVRMFCAFVVGAYIHSQGSCPAAYALFKQDCVGLPSVTVGPCSHSLAAVYSDASL